MKSYSRDVTITTFLFLIFCTLLNGQDLNKDISFKPVNLKTDYLEAPVGIDNPNPRLNWNIEDNRQNAKQTAYRLIVGTNFENVYNILSTTPVSGSFSGISWDTGVVKSENQLITYAPSIKSRLL